MATGSVDSRTTSTLSANSPPLPDNYPLLRALVQSPDTFLSPSDFSSLRSSSLAAAKAFLDPVARQLAASTGKKRKNDVILDRIYTEGFDVGQVWQQVSGIVGAVEGGIEKRRRIEGTAPNGSPAVEEWQGFSEDDQDTPKANGAESSEEEQGDGDDHSSDEEDSDGDKDQNDMNMDEMGDFDDDDQDEDEDDEDDEDPGEFVKDVHGLNDGFFSIDDFNKMTERFELMDQGVLEDSDDEEDEPIDFTADPDTLDLRPKKRKESAVLDEDDADSEEEDDYSDMSDAENANEIMYDDFFAPPPRAPGSKRKSKKAWLEAVPERNEEEEDSYEKIEAEMERAKRDIFDESEDEEEGDLDKLSTHQRRTALIAEEIRRLERENVEKKKWTLAGEVKAKQRPQNALLEEDLDFERVSKPVPVITTEVTSSLEDMIKNRILQGQFDDLPRRRPDDEPIIRRGRIEIDDEKSKVGLADVYENELTGADATKKNEKLEKEHKEISALFKDVMHKLDALSSWHYTPKPPSLEVSVVGDVAAIAMEDVRPTVAGEVNSGSMLAPQEVYDPREGKRSGEIVTRGGKVISKEELGTEDKKRARRRNKDRTKKRNEERGTHGVASKKEEKSEKGVVNTLKKGGVTVIGKGGERRDVDGKIINEKKGRESASGFKL